MTSNDEDDEDREWELAPQMTKPIDLAADEEWEILHRALLRRSALQKCPK